MTLKQATKQIEQMRQLGCTEVTVVPELYDTVRDGVQTVIRFSQNVGVGPRDVWMWYKNLRIRRALEF